MEAIKIIEEVSDRIKDAAALLEGLGIELISVEKRWNTGTEVHIYNGIDFLANEMGQELIETSNPLVNGTVYKEKAFTYGGVKFFQVPNSNGEYRRKKDGLPDF